MGLKDGLHLQDAHALVLALVPQDIDAVGHQEGRNTYFKEFIKVQIFCEVAVILLTKHHKKTL
jgi:hypothetical protein